MTQDGPDDTLTRVLRHARRAVVAVPGSPPVAGPAMVAYDGGPAAVDALESFAGSGLGADAPVTVVSVSEHLSSAIGLAREAVNYLAHHDIAATPHPVVRQGREADALRSAAAAANAGMVVMGAFTHGRSREWWRRSTTTRILRGENRLLYLHHHPE